MATGYIVLPMNGASLPDGSGSGNAPASPLTEVSTGTQTTNSPKVTHETYVISSTEIHLMWDFSLPGEYLSGGKLRVKWKMQTAATGNIVLKAAAAIPVDLSTDDDALVFDTVVTSGVLAVPATQGQITETLLTLTMTNAAAGRAITIMLGSESTSWTAAGNMILRSVMFEYVK